MSRIRSVHQLDGLIALNNKNCIAVFSDFDSAVLFRAHHPAWEVHVHLVIPRASHSRECVPPVGEAGVQVGEGEKRPLDGYLITAYLTDGQKAYKPAVYTAEQLGLATCPPPLLCTTKYRVVTEAILTNPAP